MRRFPYEELDTIKNKYYSREDMLDNKKAEKKKMNKIAILYYNI